MSKPSQTEIDRNEFLLAILDGKTQAQAKKLIGITDHRFVERLKEALRERRSLSEAPRSGRPPVYSEDVLQDTLDWFDCNDWQLLNKEEFFTSLQEVGILDDKATERGFFYAFKTYLASCGLQLKWGRRFLAFALTPTHEAGRAVWCLENEKVFTDETVGRFWFVDEIVLEEGGHPKGERGPGSRVEKMQLQLQLGLPCPSSVAEAP